MKQITFSLALLLVISWQACNNADDRYVDVNTGKTIELEKDPETGLMVHKETGKPVDIYVDKQTKDTFYGRTGKVINGKISKRGDRYVYRDNERSSSNGSVSAESDGDVKVKRTEDEVKIKSGDYKKEIEKDGDITIKNGDTKIKIDGETGERKVKKDD